MEIKELILYTNQLEKQHEFYSESLEFEQISFSKSEAAFKIGNSILKFVKRKEATPYHFAFNIPSNKEIEALKWLKERVRILKYENKEIQDFVTWNAKAIYFYDPDKNIVEFIARKNLKIEHEGKFNSHSLLEISEIGIPTNNIKNKYKKLINEIGLQIYSGTIDVFCAIGDERGLFICMNKNKRRWFPVNDEAFSSNFKAKVINENKIFEIKYSKEKLITLKL